MAQAAPQSASGYMSDFQKFSSAMTDVLETIPTLAWPESVHTYGKMRTDPQLTAVLNAYTLPLRAAPKYVHPAGCRAEVVQLVSDDLGLPILGADKEPGPARRRGVDFDEHFRVALLCLIYGHMPFAQQYEIRDGKARLVELAERMPTTITDILTTDDGKLDGVLQFGEKEIIPARNLVWYAHEREGSAWQGRSMLRPAYGAWLLKHEMWRVLATSNDRFGMGVPWVEAPLGATDGQIQEAALMTSQMRSGQYSGAALPFGFKFHLDGMSGGAPNTLDFIRYLDSQMAQMALASVLNLDASPNGSRALGDTFVNLMLTALNAVGKQMSSVLTALAVQMVTYNWGEDEPVPRIVIGDVGSRPEVTAEAIMGLLSAGAISADPELERWARERWNMPDKEVPEETDGPLGPNPRELVEMVQKVYLGVGTVLTVEEARGMLNAAGANLTGPPPTQEVAAPPAPAPEPAVPAIAAGHRGYRRSIRAGASTADRRALSTMEAASGVDPEALDANWTSTVDELIKNWSKISRAQRLELTNQIAAAVDDDRVDGLAELAVDSLSAAEMLRDAMLTMASDAAKEMKKEARKQGVSVSGEEIDEDRLSGTASAVASIMAAGLAGAAGREAIRVWSSGRTGSEVADDVDAHMRDLSDNYLREQLGGAISAAQNHGRQAVLTAAPPAKYFASEVLDTNTCKKCRDIDGTQFDGQDEAAQAYASGGYTECLGRLRCRGIVVAVWDD